MNHSELIECAVKLTQEENIELLGYLEYPTNKLSVYEIYLTKIGDPIQRLMGCLIIKTESDIKLLHKSYFNVKDLQAVQYHIQDMLHYFFKDMGVSMPHSLLKFV